MNRRKSMTAYFEKMKVDFSFIENEKRKTAADVHDGIGAYLTAIKLLTDEAFEKIPAETVLQTKIDQAFQRAFASFRSVLHNATPLTLQREGLYAAVKELAEMIFPNESVRVAFDFFLEGECIEDDSLLHVYRIIQELLNNIHKHANATEISILVKRQKSNLIVEITDNGAGFVEREVTNHTKGFGLNSVRNRILFLRGDVFLETFPGKGTQFQILLPVFQN